MGCGSIASVILLGSCGGSFTPPAAVVGGRTISQATLSEAVREFLTDPTTAQQVAAGGATARGDFTRRVLRYLIEVDLARGYADTHGIRVTANEVQSGLSQAEQQQGGPRAFRKFLAGRGLTVQEVETNVERVLLLTKVSRSLAPGATSSQAAQGAFEQWLRQRVHAVDVRVNPRFGTFDPRSTDIVPIDTTALLPG